VGCWRDHPDCARPRGLALFFLDSPHVQDTGMTSAPSLDHYLDRFPLIAILRGVRPDEAEAIGDVLVAEGFSILEVPLNSPDPLASIERLARRFPDTLVGAGTVMTPQAVQDVAAAGGRLVLMPHSDPIVVRAACEAGLLCVPGVATPTEAFAAVANGAAALKLFPAEQMPPAVVKAWRAVVPHSVRLLPVGGIAPDTMAPYLAAGAAGFGLGSALYRPGMEPAEVGERARAFRTALGR
jgi:2-dehydro-3-deoxyphosphogalactonate aldolase